MLYHWHLLGTPHDEKPVILLLLSNVLWIYRRDEHMRNRRAQYTQPIIRWRWPDLFSMLLLACLLLLNACSDSNDSYANKKGSQPAVSMSLLQEGQLQLQTFQQWLGLMQQFKGDISP